MNNVGLAAVVRSIPVGKVASYGEVGRALKHPVSGFQVGRMLARCQDDLPWWRVVATTGELPLRKRDLGSGMEQRRRLLEEGVPFDGDIVQPEAFVKPELYALE